VSRFIALHLVQTVIGFVITISSLQCGAWHHAFQQPSVLTQQAFCPVDISLVWVLTCALT